ncbi:MAG: signal recognition particle receptor subunit alpha, partial [Kofleriaceae bacterium]
MQPDELIKLGIAIAVLVMVIFLLRRASARSQAKGGATARERLGQQAVEDARPKRQRKRPRPGQEGKAAEPEPEAELPEVPEVPEGEVAEEEAAAYKAGLAKTKGGFVAKLGKLFGKKKIDAATLDELEETLFTADIGPRAAERIFTSVKSGLSKNDLENP